MNKGKGKQPDGELKEAWAAKNGLPQKLCIFSAADRIRLIYKQNQHISDERHSLPIVCLNTGYWEGLL